MFNLTFKPQKVTKELVAAVGNNERAKDVLYRRFGLFGDPEKMTLDAIGQKYGITRERVRQIESFAINRIKQSDAFESAAQRFDEIKNIFAAGGGVMAEHDFLDRLTKDKEAQNHVHFLLVLGDEFSKLKEDDHFHPHWTIDEGRAEDVRSVLKQVHNELKEEDLFTEDEIISLLQKKAEKNIGEKINEEIVRFWLNMSKIIAKNPVNEWGHAESSSINPKGMRDYAFLVLRKHGEPLHFTDIAKKIGDYADRKANPFTVHNELIKDDNFVLVGRGLYALKDWGYREGAVRDIIVSVLKDSGPLTKEEIIKSVLKERYIKENTILVNLQNRRYFVRNKENKYAVA